MAFVFLLACLLAGGVRADFSQGQRAYEAGDYMTALELWTPLAEAGDARAQYFLGILYDDGLGAQDDAATAAEWYRRAADQGLAEAQFAIGLMRYGGHGVPRDLKIARDWIARAAEQGLPPAQSVLASIYYSGAGVPRDYVEAYKWLEIAATISPNDISSDLRDVAAKAMTAEEVEQAKARAKAWLAAR